MVVKVLFPMADYGHDPTEVAIPFSVFQNSGFDITFTTETGLSPQCDTKMLAGMTGTLLGADRKAKKAYQEMISSSESWKKPISWSSNNPNFDMDEYDLVFLPGGHDKGVRQVIDSEKIHDQLARYFPKTLRVGGGGEGKKNKKVVAAVCHGVQVLAFTPASDSSLKTFPLSSVSSPPTSPPSSSSSSRDENENASFKSIIHSCTTTALPGFMETSIYQATRVFLGPYYKTYGASTPNVEDFVRTGLDKPDQQFKTGPGWYSPSMNKPFVVEDDRYRYVSGRFPPDAEMLAKRAVELVKEATSV